MQELRFVAVSEDGRYAVLAVPGRSARFTLPIDERLRAVALGQTSRLVQYEIEVENPLRPKEIQARIRAGETVEEIADAAGIAVERVRWFEGPVLAERAYMADQAQRASVRRQGDSAPSTPGPRLGEIVTERLQASVPIRKTLNGTRKSAATEAGKFSSRSSPVAACTRPSGSSIRAAGTCCPLTITPPACRCQAASCPSPPSRRRARRQSPSWPQGSAPRQARGSASPGRVHRGSPRSALVTAVLVTADPATAELVTAELVTAELVTAELVTAAGPGTSGRAPRGRLSPSPHRRHRPRRHRPRRHRPQKYRRQ